MAKGRTFVIRLVGDSKSAQAAFTRVTGGAVKFAAAFTAASIVVGAVGRAISKSTQAAIEYDRSLLKLTTQIGITREAAKAMGDQILTMNTFGVGAQELADAMFFISSAGLRGADAMEALEFSAKGAAIGLGDTATVADLVTSAMNAYGPAVLGAADATDVIIAAVREGKAEASELAGSMGAVLPIASAMGVQFHEVGGVIAAMTRTGTDAATAVTQLRAIMTTLLKPSAQTEQALNAIGLSSAGLRDTIMRDGLWAAMTQLNEAADGSPEILGAVFRNVRALAGAMDLLGPSMEENARIMDRMGDSTGLADEAFSTFAMSTGGQIDILKSQWESLFVVMGQANTGVVANNVSVLNAALRELTMFVADAEGKQDLYNRRMSEGRDALQRARDMLEGTSGAQRDAVRSSEAYRAAIRDAEFALEGMNVAGLSNRQTLKQFIEVQRQGADVQNELTESVLAFSTAAEQEARSTAAQTERMNALAESFGHAADNSAALEEAQALVTAEMWGQVEAIDQQKDAMLRLVNPQYDLIRAAEENEKAQANLDKVLSDSTSTTDEIAEATLDAAKKYIELDAAVKTSEAIMGDFIDGPMSELVEIGVITQQAMDKVAESLQGISDKHTALNGRKTRSDHEVVIRYIEANSPPVQGVPGMATGGPVKANKLYLVGEQGPELFAASTGGRIFPTQETMSFLNERPTTQEVSFDMQRDGGSAITLEPGAIRVDLTVNGAGSVRDVSRAVDSSMDDAIARLARELAVS